MALVQAITLLTSAVYEAASLMWMELAMFFMAALVYALSTGNISRRIKGVMPRKKLLDSDGIPSAPEASGAVSETEHELKEHVSRGDHRAVLRLWTRVKSLDNIPRIDLAIFAESMQKLGRSPTDVVAELRLALKGNPALLSAMIALPAALLRDDSVELLDGVLLLLEQHEHRADVNAYAGLMGAKLRRRDYAGVASTAARLPAASLTPKMHAMLATAAGHHGNLDAALGHIRQMPEPADGARCTLASGAVAQILALAAREQRTASASQELRRICVKLEPRHFDDLLLAEAKRGSVASCRELLLAGEILNVQKGLGAYQALAGVLAQSADEAGIHDMLAQLEREVQKGQAGISVSEPLALALLEACKAIHDGKLVSRILELHRKACAGAPGRKVLCACCAALVACGEAEAACDFFESDLAPKGVMPDASLNSALQKVATDIGRSTLVQRLVDCASSLKSQGHGGSGAGAGGELQRYATMIKAYSKERDLDGAKNTFSRVKASGITMSPMIYNCFLDACVQCGDIDRAMAHFEEMRQLNFVDVVSCNTILKAYLTRGNTEKARALVQEMASRGLQANKVTYNELIHHQVLAKDRKGIWSLVDEMQAAGVRANSVTCSILLKSLTFQSSAADVRRVIGLVDDVEDAIDEVLFSSVIEACIRIRQLDLLSDLMRRYRQKGGFVNLTAPTYGSMIKAYGQAGDIGRVRELWHEMEERGVKPTSVTLGCMAEALVTNNQAEEAWQMIHKQFDSDERKGCINTVIYSTVLKGFAVNKRIDKVFSVYKEMREKSIPCNTITYNTMLDACAKCCAMTRASQLLEDMRESSIEPDIITYSTIVKGYCLEGDVDRAFHVLDDMKSDGKFAPDEIMYNSILDGCAKQHRVDEALRVLDEMKTAGVGPSNYTLSILVKLLGHARRLSQAFRMVEELSNQNGFRPNVQVYTCLVQACILNRRLERALGLHDTVVTDAACTTDEKFYAVLVRGCLQLHQPLKAVDVVRAAYQLPGHCLATPARKGARIVGVEARALEEVIARLQASGKEEQEAMAKLTSDLLEMRGVSLNECQGSGGTSRRGGGGGRRGGGRPTGKGGGKGA